MSLLIATPMYQGCSSQFFLSMLKTANALNRINLNHGVQVCEGIALITAARNELVRGFLGSEFDRLLFIDADIAFSPDNVLSLYDQDLDVVCGAYPLKNLPLRYGFFKDGRAVNPFDYQETIEIDLAGCGFMMIKREVFKAMAQHVPSYETPLGPVHKFFDTEVRDGLDLSECFTFCERWRDLGGKIHLDPRLKLAHVGQFVYR